MSNSFCVYGPAVYLLRKNTKIFAHLKNGQFIFLSVSCKFLLYSGYNLLITSMIYKYFLWSCELFFASFLVFYMFSGAQINFDEIQFTCFFFLLFCLWVHLQENIAKPRLWWFVTMFSYKTIIMLVLNGRCWIHCSLIFLYAVIGNPSVFFSSYSVPPVPIVENTVFCNWMALDFESAALFLNS